MAEQEQPINIQIDEPENDHGGDSDFASAQSELPSHHSHATTAFHDHREGVPLRYFDDDLDTFTPQLAKDLYTAEQLAALRSPGLRTPILSTGERVDYVLTYYLPKHKTYADLVSLMRDPDEADSRTVKDAAKRFRFEHELVAKGLKLEHEMGSDGRVVYIKVHAPFNVLCARAEKFQFKMPLKQTVLGASVAKVAESHRNTCYKTLRRRVPPQLVRLFANKFETDRAQHSSALFSLGNAEKFLNYENPELFFSPAQRNLLLYYILNNTKYADDGSKVGIYRLVYHKTYSMAFPPHDSPATRLANIDEEAQAEMSWQEYGRQAADNYLRRYGDANVRHIRQVDHDVGSDVAPGEEGLAPEPLARPMEPRAPQRTRSQFSRLQESKGSHVSTAQSFSQSEKKRQQSKAIQHDALSKRYGQRAVLYELWGRFGAWRHSQPLQLIRAYYGEKVAIYFAFLGNYTLWLVLPSILGVLTLFYGLGTYDGREDTKELCDSDFVICGACDSCNQWELKDSCLAYQVLYIFDNEATVAYAFFMSIWATLFHANWLRHEAELAYDWDVDDIVDIEPQRAGFEAKDGKTRLNPVTDAEEKHYPKTDRFKKYAVTFSVVLTICACVIIALVGTIVYRLSIYISLLRDSNGSEAAQTEASLIASTSAAVINLVFILILSLLYPFLAIALTNWENHRTDSSYERHLTFKVFMFNAINLYSSLFYVAFFQSRDIGVPGNYDELFSLQANPCPTYGCMTELLIQLSIIMTGKQILNNVLEIGFPIIWAWCARKGELRRMRRKQRAELSADGRLYSSADFDSMLLPWEDDFLKLSPMPPLGMYNDYLELAVQFGFITMFVASFSLAPLLALINNILEIRVDGSKMESLFLRQPALRASSIGIWNEVIGIIAMIAVITNGLVIVVTSDFVDKRVYSSNNGGSLKGYIDAIYAESPLEDSGTPNLEDCRYAGFYDDEGNRNALYWEIWFAKLSFFIAFEHAVFFIRIVYSYAVETVPKWVRIAKRREAFQARAIIEGLDPHHYTDTAEVEANEGHKAESPPTTSTPVHQEGLRYRGTGAPATIIKVVNGTTIHETVT
eukprot:m.171086 g.171086  ORF g.171086 m.171086 type:complete len:1079 (-) comp16700_c1_seq1:61-3297(-)